MGRLLDGPAVPEERDGDEEGKDYGQRQPHFWGEGVVVACLEAFQDFIACEAEDDLADEEAQTEADVGEAAGGERPVVCVFEDGGDCCEEEVEAAVDDGDVEGDEGDDGGVNEELNWDCEAVQEEAERCSVGFDGFLVFLFVAASEVGSVQLLLQLACFAFH